LSVLLHAVGQIFLFCVLVIACLAVLRRIAMAAFGPGANGRTPVRRGKAAASLRSPAAATRRRAGRSTVAAITHPGNSQIRTQARADVRRAWETVRATDWIEQRRHDRANGTAAAPGTTAIADKAPPRRRFRPWTQADAGAATGGPPANAPPGGGNGTVPGGAQAPPAPAPPGNQAPPGGPPAPPPITTGGTTVPAGTSTAAGEKLIEGISEIYARAASGGISAKQEAIRAAHEAAVRFAGMCQMLARAMSEPGSNYGPEITEPISRAGQHFQAGAMSLSEADANLETLANMTLREVSQSPRQAPHHQNELSETGRH